MVECGARQHTEAAKTTSPRNQAVKGVSFIPIHFKIVMEHFLCVQVSSKDLELDWEKCVCVCVCELLLVDVMFQRNKM